MPPPARRPELNRLSWPPLRTDVAALFFAAVSVYCLVSGRWPAIVALAIIATAFCAVAPRMKGRFGLTGGGARLGGEFVSPFDEPALPVTPAEPDALGPPREPLQELPPGTPPDEG